MKNPRNNANIGWSSIFTGMFSRRRSTAFTGRSAVETARLGLRGARDRHACALNYKGWAGREEAGSARKD